MEGVTSYSDIIFEGLALITIAVPPALPTCLQIGTSVAMGRLKKFGIYCISPPKVNVFGKIAFMCFDKTGTLTENNLGIYGIRPVGDRG
jgi:cation-transporting ATPase 13A3/4/5